jgi:hypothetical protein
VHSLTDVVRGFVRYRAFVDAESEHRVYIHVMV